MVKKWQNMQCYCVMLATPHTQYGTFGYLNNRNIVEKLWIRNWYSIIVKMIMQFLYSHLHHKEIVHDFHSMRYRDCSCAANFPIVHSALQTFILCQTMNWLMCFSTSNESIGSEDESSLKNRQSNRIAIAANLPRTYDVERLGLHKAIFTCMCDRFWFSVVF